MKNYVNLMSEAAQFRVAARRRVRQWISGLTILTLVLAGLAGERWLSYGIFKEQFEALEARYEPIQELTLASRTLRQEATELVKKDKAPLELARRPSAIALLELVGRAVQSCGGKAYLQRISLAPVDNATTAGVDSGRVTIQVITELDADVNSLIAILKAAPFSEVKVLSSEILPNEGQGRKVLSLECTY